MNRTLRCVLTTLLVVALLLATSVALIAARAGHWLESPSQAPRRADAIAILGGDEEGERWEDPGVYAQEEAPDVESHGTRICDVHRDDVANYRSARDRQQ